MKVGVIIINLVTIFFRLPDPSYFGLYRLQSLAFVAGFGSDSQGVRFAYGERATFA